MANNCNNFIKIKGDVNSIALLLKDLKKYSESDVQGIFSLEMSKLEPHVDEYPKWFLINDLVINGETMIISAVSAWTHAISVFEYLSRLHPTLHFKYYYDEQGVDIGGYAELQNGLNEHQDLGYWRAILHEDNDYFFSHLEEEIDFLLDDNESLSITDFGSSLSDCIDEKQFNEIIEKLKK